MSDELEVVEVIEAPAESSLDYEGSRDNVEVVNEFKAALEATKPKVDEAKPEPTAIEKRAMEQGWRPEHEFDKSKGRRFIGAEEFLERGELFGKIESQKSEINQLKKVVKEFGEHLQKSQAATYQNTLMDLDRQRQEAVKAGNHAKFIAAEQQMLAEQQRLQQMAFQPEPEPIPQQPQVSADAAAFVERNKRWFNTSPENADKISIASQAEEYFKSINPGAKEKDIFSFVEQEVHRYFPELENKKRYEPAPVATKTQSVGGNKTNLSSRLSPQQKHMAAELVKMGAFKSSEEYAKQLELQGVLPRE